MSTTANQEAMAPRQVGRAFAGLLLALLVAVQQVARTLTAADGSYRLTAPPNASYLLITSAARFRPSASMVTVNGQPVRRDVEMTGAGGDGWYDVDDVPGGAYTLTVTAAGHQPAAVPLIATECEQATHDVELGLTARLGGVVRAGRFDRPIPEAQVTLLDPDGEMVATMLTDEEGRYAFTNLPASDYTLVTNGYAPVATPLEVVAGTPLSRDVQLTHPAA